MYSTLTSINALFEDFTMPSWSIELVIAFTNLLVTSVQPIVLLWHLIQQRRHAAEPQGGPLTHLLSLLC
jgi:hypothetical protein